MVQQEQSVFSAPITLPSLHLQHHSIALFSRAAQVIGGDYADVFEFEDGVHIGLVILDVVGKGVKAGFQTKAWKTLLGQELKKYDSPERALFHINNLAEASEHITRPAPLFYAMLNTQTGVLRYCNAGHDHPLCFSNGQISELSAGGFPLGADQNESYELGTVHLNPGDMVLLYTDGITEANHGEGEEFGVSRLQTFLLHAHQKPAQFALSALIQQIEDYTDYTSQHDDLTCIILSATPDTTLSESALSRIPSENFTEIFGQNYDDFFSGIEVTSEDQAYNSYDIRVIYRHLQSSLFADLQPKLYMTLEEGQVCGKILFSNKPTETALHKLLTQLHNKFEKVTCIQEPSFEVQFNRSLGPSFKPAPKNAGVVIVDPDDTLRGYAQEHLSAILPITYAQTLESALTHIHQRPNSIKLVIVSSEQFNWDFFEKIKAQNSLVEIIVTTETFDAWRWIEKLEKGVFEVIKSPYQDTTLQETVQRALERVNTAQKNSIDNYTQFSDTLTQTLDTLKSTLPTLVGKTLYDVFVEKPESFYANVRKTLDEQFEDHYADQGFLALVIEDEPDVSTFISKTLLREGMSTVTSLTPEDALLKVESEPIDFILCDIGLPGMSGTDLIQKIKAKRPELEVVMVTGFKEEDKVSSAFKNDILTYLTKPVDRTKLIEVAEQAARVRFYKKILGNLGYLYFVKKQHDCIARSLIFKAAFTKGERTETPTLGQLAQLFPELTLDPLAESITIPLTKLKNNVFELVEDAFLLG